MHVLDSLLHLLAPHSCLGCGREGLLLCDMCAETYIDPVPARCYRCLKLSQDSRVCRSCRYSSKLRHVWVGADYEGLAKRLVAQLKFERARAAATPIAEHLAAVLPYLPLDTVITYVPTATSRERMRGYDQSRLIAKELANINGCQYVPLLGRVGQTRQVGASRKERLQQMRNSFYVLPHRHIDPGQSIVIVDDIVTTGASVEAAAQVLREAGARSVSAAVFAQKH